MSDNIPYINNATTPWDASQGCVHCFIGHEINHRPMQEAFPNANNVPYSNILNTSIRKIDFTPRTPNEVEAISIEFNRYNSVFGSTYSVLKKNTVVEISYVYELLGSIQTVFGFIDSIELYRGKTFDTSMKTDQSNCEYLITIITPSGNATPPNFDNCTKTKILSSNIRNINIISDNIGDKTMTNVYRMSLNMNYKYSSPEDKDYFTKDMVHYPILITNINTAHFVGDGSLIESYAWYSNLSGYSKVLYPTMHRDSDVTKDASQILDYHIPCDIADGVYNIYLLTSPKLTENQVSNIGKLYVDHMNNIFVLVVETEDVHNPISVSEFSYEFFDYNAHTWDQSKTMTKYEPIIISADPTILTDKNNRFEYWSDDDSLAISFKYGGHLNPSLTVLGLDGTIKAALHIGFGKSIKIFNLPKDPIGVTIKHYEPAFNANKSGYNHDWHTIVDNKIVTINEDAPTMFTIKADEFYATAPSSIQNISPTCDIVINMIRYSHACNKQIKIIDWTQLIYLFGSAYGAPDPEWKKFIHVQLVGKQLIGHTYTDRSVSVPAYVDRDGFVIIPNVSSVMYNNYLEISYSNVMQDRHHLCDWFISIPISNNNISDPIQKISGIENIRLKINFTFESGDPCLKTILDSINANFDSETVISYEWEDYPNTSNCTYSEKVLHEEPIGGRGFRPSLYIYAPISSKYTNHHISFILSNGKHYTIPFKVSEVDGSHTLSSTINIDNFVDDFISDDVPTSEEKKLYIGIKYLRKNQPSKLITDKCLLSIIDSSTNKKIILTPGMSCSSKGETYVDNKNTKFGISLNLSNADNLYIEILPIGAIGDDISDNYTKNPIRYKYSTIVKSVSDGNWFKNSAVENIELAYIDSVPYIIHDSSNSIFKNPIKFTVCAPTSASPTAWYKCVTIYDGKAGYVTLNFIEDAIVTACYVSSDDSSIPIETNLGQVKFDDNGVLKSTNYFKDCTKTSAKVDFKMINPDATPRPEDFDIHEAEPASSDDINALLDTNKETSSEG